MEPRSPNGFGNYTVSSKVEIGYAERAVFPRISLPLAHLPQCRNASVTTRKPDVSIAQETCSRKHSM
jgi:hypothetical protein